MAVIFHDGLANGQRLRLCSDAARLWFPHLFTQANTLARMEIDYSKNVLVYGMEAPPSEARFAKLIAEYQTNYLLFLYQQPKTGATWGQWWAKENSLPQYKSKQDLASPAPPAGAFEAWQRQYAEAKRQAAAKAFGDLPMSGGPSGPVDAPQAALVAAVLDACREWFPATDDAMARQIVMVGLAVRPGWLPKDVLIPMRLARWKQHESAAGYLRTLPAVLKTLANQEAQMALFAPAVEESPIGSGLSDQEIAALDRERVAAKIKAS